MPVAGSTCESHEAQTLKPHGIRLKIPPASEACNTARRRFSLEIGDNVDVASMLQFDLRQSLFPISF